MKIKVKKRCLVTAIAALSVLPLQATPFAKGADVSWLPEMEATHYRFYNSEGEPQDCLQILKDNGINTIRLRVFVNPSLDPRSGHCNPEEVEAMALRAKKMGFRILIDFHYSDTWADPGHQEKPAAWSQHPFPQLLQDVYHHTYNVLAALKAEGVTPEWVQIGNEIPGGLLWPDGKTSHWPQLAGLLNIGYDAVKRIDPAIKVIVHLDEGNNHVKFEHFFEAFSKQGGKWDVIGLSYYPYWLKKDYTDTIEDLKSNLINLSQRFHKEVMVVEIGGPANKPENTYNMLVAVQQAVESVPNGKGLGIVYWEPEGAGNWSGYPLSCWGSNGRPTQALSAFRIISP